MFPLPLVYSELRRLALDRLEQRREGEGQRLDPTELVNEAYLRLIDQTRASSTGRAPFMAVAATAMRRILVDHARSARGLDRTVPLHDLSFETIDVSTDERARLLIAVDDALTLLERLDARQAHVVECRFFGGLSERETADALGIDAQTAKREWARAKIWLQHEVAGRGGVLRPDPSNAPESTS